MNISDFYTEIKCKLVERNIYAKLNECYIEINFNGYIYSLHLIDSVNSFKIKPLKTYKNIKTYFNFLTYENCKKHIPLIASTIQDVLVKDYEKTRKNKTRYITANRIKKVLYSFFILLFILFTK